MLLFGIPTCLALLTLLCANLAFQTDHDYYDYGQEEADEGTEFLEPDRPDLEKQLRSAGSVDELMRLLDPTNWNILKCRSKRDFNLHGDAEMSFAAAYSNNFDMFRMIEAEWRKTLCMPREVCLDVAKEFGAATNTFYKPPCVLVHRCGGCCNSEEHQCMNISTGFISKTLLEITVPVKQQPKPVTISFANHTSCSCLSKLDVYRQKHSIIRRALPECHVVNRTCLKSQIWSNSLCRCVPLHDSILPQSRAGLLEQDFCGPNKELDEETCQCGCRKEVRTASCGPRRHLDKNTCQCVCKTQPSSCGPHHIFNQDTCQCTCTKTCPSTHPLNRTKCACECTETVSKCFLRGRRFQPSTCSCYRLPCNVDPNRRRCKEGFYFYEGVCNCIPNHVRGLD